MLIELIIFIILPICCYALCIGFMGKMFNITFDIPSYFTNLPNLISSLSPFYFVFFWIGIYILSVNTGINTTGINNTGINTIGINNTGINTNIFSNIHKPFLFNDNVAIPIPFLIFTLVCFLIGIFKLIFNNTRTIYNSSPQYINKLDDESVISSKN